METRSRPRVGWVQSAYQVTRVYVRERQPVTWEPAINVFRCETGVRICLELAGVDKSIIEVTVEARRVVVRGTREAPEPTEHEGRAVQVLALEIDYGPFEREVQLPIEIDVK